MIVRIALAFSFTLSAMVVAADDPATMTAETVCESYKTFTRITSQKPKEVSGAFSVGGCGSFDLSLILKETSIAVMGEGGPHVAHYIHYYLNDIALRHRNAHNDVEYPPGSVIVKEKLLGVCASKYEDFIEGSGGKILIGVAPSPYVDLKIDAVAGMIKRQPGSSPGTGDWEFFYFSPATAATRTMYAWKKEMNLRNCVGCHSSAADMVFSRFDKHQPLPGLDEMSPWMVGLEMSAAFEENIGKIGLGLPAEMKLQRVSPR